MTKVINNRTNIEKLCFNKINDFILDGMPCDKVIYNFAKRELKAEVIAVIDKECIDYENTNIEVKDKNILILEKLENRYN